MSNTVGYVQLQSLAKDLSAASGEPFKAAAQDLVMSTAQQVQTYAQAYAPRKTGRLANSIGVTVSNSGTSATVTANAPYAAFDEFGTGVRGEFPGSPIVITPKRAQYLRFVGRDGKVVFTKKVVNPGMAPRPFMRPAVERIAVPFAGNLANQGVVFIVRGPNAPETLTNAPATGWH